MTAIPCGQKKSIRAMIHNQTVTPPLAAIDGTTLRLKTATTKSRTRSQRPRTRFKFVGLALEDNQDSRLYNREGTDFIRAVHRAEINSRHEKACPPVYL